MSAGGKVLHLLAQRPSLTGSGVTLDRLVRLAAAAGWQQRVVVGVPASEAFPRVGGLAPEQVLALRFESRELPFPVAGMSDVMPYNSTVMSTMSEPRWALYRAAWVRHLETVREQFAPDIIHSHHVWLLSAVVKDVFPDVPVLTHCHATGLRQLRLCPHRAEEIIAGVARNDGLLALDSAMATTLDRELGVPPERIHVVGAGYNDDVFDDRGRAADVAGQLLYGGKYSGAKGLPSLLDAFEKLSDADPTLRLHVAGSGSGADAEALRRRMETMEPSVVLHGQLEQVELASLMRRCAVCVLPSFYEGLPLVLIEAAACGCRIVATALPAVRDVIAPCLGAGIELLELPAMSTIDIPVAAELPEFANRLAVALRRALAAGHPAPLVGLEAFTWSAVFARVETHWRRLAG